MNIKQTIETVTPEIAYKWLQDANENNRPISDETVRRYAIDMKNDAWRPNGEPIIFDETGRLINGQHRLMASIEAGVPFKTAVVRGVHKDAWKSIDKLRPRKPGDTLRQMQQPYGNQIVAWFNQGRSLLTGAKIPASDYVIEKFQTQYPDAIIWAMDHVKPGQPFSVASVIGTFVFAHPTKPKAIEELWDAAQKGTGLVEGSPALVFRDYVLTQRIRNRDDKRTLALKVLRCCYGYLRNEKMSAQHLLAGETALDYFKRAHDEHSALRDELEPDAPKKARR